VGSRLEIKTSMVEIQKKKQLSTRALEKVNRFISWLDRYGEDSFDHQSYFAGPFGGRAKALYYKNKFLGIMAVSPMIFSEAFLPQARRLFWKPQRFPIADAHYAMAFAFLHDRYGGDEHYRRAVHFLEILEKTRCPGYENFCWGYPFDWQTKGGVVPAGTPLVTITPYVYEAFAHVHSIDGQEKWKKILHSIANHMADDFVDVDMGDGAASCSYTPDDGNGVINASAYRSALLADASHRFNEERFWEVGSANLRFVLNNQQENGSWLYAMDGVRDFVDHFHTCFVLKALVKIDQIFGDDSVSSAIDRGVEYYVKNLIDEDGLPKPFSRAPRLTVYRNELYDYAECLNLTILLEGRYPELDSIRERVLTDLFARWCKPDGSFRSRKLMIGWDNVPMHRWAQAQMFRSLSFGLSRRINEGSMLGLG
jgi:hypothetical protein